MGSHPINLAFRFLLEVAALLAIGYWGWSASTGGLRFVLAFGLPIMAAVLWGTFRVPNDASSSGKAPVPIPGILRLLLELAYFAFAVWGLYDAGAVRLSWVLGLAVVVHYALSYDRISWLIQH
jgi:hypothetical protein